MSATRASIDRTLDELSIRAAEVKQDAVRRGSVFAMVAVAALVGLWWRRRANA
jgi:nitrate reductase gamma subunit